MIYNYPMKYRRQFRRLPKHLQGIYYAFLSISTMIKIALDPYSKRPMKWMHSGTPFQYENERMVMIKLSLATVGLLFATRLSGLQFNKYTELKSVAERQQIGQVNDPQQRKIILDHHGDIVAIDLPAYDLYVHPRMCSISLERIAELLSPILDLSSQYLYNRLDEGDSGICLMHQIDTNTSAQIRRLGVDGIELVHHPQRVYPKRGSFESILGYVDTEGYGQAGLESSLDDWMKSTYQDVPCWMDGHGNFLGIRFPKQILFHQESALQLTIDCGLQEKVSQLITNAMNRFGAKRIAAIIMEAHSGAIRCLATSPSYDPNCYGWFPMERFRCWPITDLFEPGSTFKPVNLAIALENGIFQPTDRILDTGKIRIGDSWIGNVGGGFIWDRSLDHLTGTQILQRSSNVGMVRVMQSLDPAIYHRNLIRLGLGSHRNDNQTSFKMSSHDHNESGWNLKDLTSDYAISVVKDQDEFVDHEIEAATASFGQGLAMTPLKLLQLIATIANGGMAVTPHLISKIVTLDHFHHLQSMNEFSLQGWVGQSVLSRSQYHAKQPRPYTHDLYLGHVPVPSLELGWFDVKSIPPHTRERRRLFSRQTCNVLLGMLEQVVLDAQATGSRGFLPGYAMAGKTGTAQKASALGGYSTDSVVTSFVGIYPAVKPKFVTLVIIDEPEDPFRFGFNTAVDVTQTLISEMIVQEQDPPSYPTVSLFERNM
uniref:Peptidoglycan D,D-transpeptidase FtsI homolog n=1 Tax=Nephroselmis olivacea TaxID=31312 RepID=FTSIH_NEPOL|nr:peptidoglycan synthetase [Nephroselmis olivacea]Q9TL36.1 RecName: Full=Peptidoglycan D,D-transpeptidase FtsI homolog [Nephroselmis olivacea]AAD54780.1 putative peptidoglycan synthetase [Nephroselmis olivacea]